MENIGFGISDIGLYVPKNRITLDRLIDHRTFGNATLKEKFQRAKDSINQNSFRHNSSFEDVVSMGLNSLFKLDKSLFKNIKQIITATETSLDFSKPISSYILGQLIQRNYTDYSTLVYQIQNACLGGVIALVNLINSLKNNEKGVVISTDVARYSPNTTAELTQGSGSISLIVSQNPQLVEIYTNNIGYFSSNEKDFFRPINQNYPSVMGRYSMQKYYQAIFNAIKNYSQNCNLTINETLNSTDYFVFHLPFASMPDTIIEMFENDGVYLAKEKIKCVDLTKELGNIYTGSIFLSLISLLINNTNLENKTVGFIAYGSGNSAMFFKGQIKDTYKSVVDKWNMNDTLGFVDSDIEDYLNWNSFNQTLENPKNYSGFYLKSVDKDGFREYDFL